MGAGWNPGVSTSQWEALRLAALQRDDYRCCIKAPGCLGKAGTVDHRIPLSRGGTNAMSNLQSACSKCNYSKGNKVDSTELQQITEW